jgi:hypothetical protein
MVVDLTILLESCYEPTSGPQTTDPRNDEFLGYQWSLGNRVIPGPVWFPGPQARATEHDMSRDMISDQCSAVLSGTDVSLGPHHMTALQA